VCTLVTTADYEAMYAYKCGRFEQCLRLCQFDIRLLTNKTHTPLLPAFEFQSSELLHMIDDECFNFIVFTSFILATHEHFVVTQISLLLYLTVKCHLKLKHSHDVIIDAMRRLEIVFHLLDPKSITDRLILASVYRKARRTLSK
jgi:hypothetical protein